MRTFDEFPKNSVCPICKTNRNEECFLMAIDGTKEGNIEQAIPTHVECLKMNGYRYDQDRQFIYRFLD